MQVFFLYDKGGTQGFNDYLSGFRLTLFNRTSKVNISQISSFWVSFWLFSSVYDCNNSFKLKSLLFKRVITSNLIKKSIISILSKFVDVLSSILSVWELLKDNTYKNRNFVSMYSKMNVSLDLTLEKCLKYYKSVKNKSFVNFNTLTRWVKGRYSALISLQTDSPHNLPL